MSPQCRTKRRIAGGRSCVTVISVMTEISDRRGGMSRAPFGSRGAMTGFEGMLTVATASGGRHEMDRLWNGLEVAIAIAGFLGIFYVMVIWHLRVILRRMGFRTGWAFLSPFGVIVFIWVWALADWPNLPRKDG